jgi:hypothetical protein
MNYEQLYNTIQAYAENTEQLFVANIPVFVMEAEERIYNSVQLPSLRKNVTGTLTTGNQYLALPTDYLSTFSLAVIDGSGNYTFLLNKDVNFLREAYPTTVTTSGVQQGTPQGIPKYYSLFGSQNGYNGSNIDDLTFMLAPTPDSNYQVEMHYFYYPPTIVQGQISTLGTITGGSLYTNGVYQNVPLTYANTSQVNNSGANATADVVISGGAVTSVTLTFGGNFYVVGDILTCTSLGSTGSGFSIPVTTISNSTGRSWLGDNYDPVLLYGAMREAMIFMKGEQDMVAYYEKMYEEALGQLNRLGTGLERGDAYRDGQARIKVTQ